MQTCWIDYWVDHEWVHHLRNHVPSELSGQVRFRNVREIPADRTGVLQYGNGEGAIQLRWDGNRCKVWFWYPGNDPGVIAHFEHWFWRESERYFHQQAIAAAPADRREAVRAAVPPPLGGDPARVLQELHWQYRSRLAAIAGELPSVPDIQVERTSLHSVALPQALAIAVVLFAVYFVCVCLMPSMTCEERDKGQLLAQTLSPATSLEILSSKAFVFVPLAAGLALLLGGLSRPEAFGDPLLIASVLVSAVGYFGIGSILSVLARTQRAASLAAMGYALVVALIIFSTQQSGHRALSLAFLEFHIPPLVLAGLNGTAAAVHWESLIIIACIAGLWSLSAGVWIYFLGWRAL
jgi:hypothetical protein